MGVDSKGNPGHTFLHRRADCSDLVGHRASVRITKNQTLRATFRSSLQRLHRVLMIILVTIEEVLGIINDFPASLTKIPHCIFDHGEIFFGCRLENLRDVKLPAFPKNSDYRSRRINEKLHLRVVFHREIMTPG